MLFENTNQTGPKRLNETFKTTTLFSWDFIRESQEINPIIANQSLMTASSPAVSA